ncbi:MAG TPA: MaoC/PaaZ C-terminal domain-containing protein [Spirochaetota bacterium]|nr:MaoC/PaaZ C-terminal domain-containing protein [Spirochaetota bacterium]
MKNLDILAALVRNRNSRALNRSLVRFAMPDFDVTIAHRDIAAYAKATGDANPAYAAPDGPVPPFFLSRLIFDNVKRLLIHRDLGMNLMRMVHGELDAAWHRSLRAGDRVRVRVYIKEISDTAAGELLVLAGEGYMDGQRALEASLGFIMRKAGGSGRKHDADEAAAPKELFRREVRTWDGQEREYARVSGDTMPIHTSTLVAKLAGLPRTILHGVCQMAMCTAAFADERLSGDIARLASVRGRFAGIVIPGWTLTLVGFASDEPNTVPFTVLDPKGRAVIKNGLFRHR